MRAAAIHGDLRQGAREQALADFMSGKVPVNLNFTAGRESMALAIERAGITTILTSRRFLSKAGLEESGGMIFLEDVLKEQILLALPVKQVCRADCKGICPQ